MDEKEERKIRISFFVGCLKVEEWLRDKSNEELFRMRQEIKVFLIGHISKCPECHEKYGGKLELLRKQEQ